MSIKIVVSNTLKFKVKGTIKDEAGIDQPFDFVLTCKRLNADEIQGKLRSESESSFADFMANVIEGWSGVKSADDEPLPYTEENFRALCRIQGVSSVVFATYLKEVGAKEKN